VEIRYICPSCGAAGRIAPPLPEAGAACRACSRALPLAGASAFDPARPVIECVVCGDDKLYIQKDFNQKVGFLIVGAGAALVPWTYGLSLAVCALADYILYRLLPSITVCYICASRYRGHPLNPDHLPYDLVTAQTYEARSLTWRRLNGLNSPDGDLRLT